MTVVGGPPIVEYWMEKCMILHRFELLEKKAYSFLKAQEASLHAIIRRHINNRGWRVIEVTWGGYLDVPV